MIRHTIMWKFTDEFEKMDKQQIMERVKNGLTSLVDVVPGLKNASVEPDVLHSERSYDMIYISEFESMEALEAYQSNPDHLRIAGFIRQVRTAQAVTDTVIEDR